MLWSNLVETPSRLGHQPTLSPARFSALYRAFEDKFQPLLSIADHRQSLSKIYLTSAEADFYFAFNHLAGCCDKVKAPPQSSPPRRLCNGKVIQEYTLGGCVWFSQASLLHWKPLLPDTAWLENFIKYVPSAAHLYWWHNPNPFPSYCRCFLLEKNYLAYFTIIPAVSSKFVFLVEPYFRLTAYSMFLKLVTLTAIRDISLVSSNTINVEEQRQG